MQLVMTVALDSLDSGRKLNNAMRTKGDLMVAFERSMESMPDSWVLEPGQNRPLLDSSGNVVGSWHILPEAKPPSAPMPPVPRRRFFGLWPR